MRMTAEDYKAKSIHIFAWPFYLDIDKENDFKLSDIVDNLTEEHNWKKAENDLNNADDYMLKQYMSNSAREIFTPKQKSRPSKEKELICVRLKKKNIDAYDYTIIKEQYNLHVDLKITGIELHLYRYGFGILFIRVVNPESDLAKIQLINDFGRRIELPLYVSNHEDFSLCADEIGIKEVDSTLRLENGKIAPFLKKLIVHDPKAFPWEITGTADDRMFLMCLVRNDELSNQLHKLYDDSSANSKDKSDLEKQIYSIIFADTEDPTCQNQKMRRQLLENAIDPRWTDYGTLHAATNTTLFCITGEDNELKNNLNDKVVKPFIVEYMYLLSLVIAQRLGIGLYSIKAGEKVIGADEKGLMKTKQTKQLVNLQEQYVAFENQMMILKFTTQDQGIELYDILQKQLQVKDEQSLLDDQLESLYEITNVSSDKELQLLAAILAALAIVIDVIVNVLLSDIACWLKAIISLLVLAIAGVAVYKMYKYLFAREIMKVHFS